jgi:hypothetical protein
MTPASSISDAAERRTALEWLALARQQEREGELFRAYDLAMQGLAEHPGDSALRHRAVLCLASTGATQRAKAKYMELRLDRISVDESGSLARRLIMDIAALRARLAKDEALKSQGEARPTKLTQAADLYEAIFRDETDAENPEAYYPAINAATLRLLAGKTAAAQRLARATLEVIEATPAEMRGYYEMASSVEALLILGRFDEARALATTARASRDWSSEMDFRALAGTLRQLHLVSEAKGVDPSWINALQLPHVAHYLGHIIAAPGAGGRFAAEEEMTVRSKIAAALEGAPIGFAYGSLAAGADILFAEAFLARGASLHLVLPFNEPEFIEISVRRAGGEWVERYRRCRASAASIRFATEDKYLGEDRLFTYCSELAMGLAVLRARHLSTEAQQFAVWDGRPPSGPAGTAADVALWQRTGNRQTIISCGDGAAAAGSIFHEGDLHGRRTRAMLFGDVKGFSKLTDEELPRFTGVVLGRVRAGDRSIRFRRADGEYMG